MTDRALILQEKQSLRTRIRAWREMLSTQQVTEAGEALAAQGLSFLPPLAAQAVVSAFAPLPDELRIWPMLRRLVGDGIRLALPVMQGRGKPLLFRAWMPGDAMNTAVWGIAEPKSDKPELEPDILLVPLLAFDRKGGRLGYGGGFYDRTLQGLRARKSVVAVGLGYDEQEIVAVPCLDYDQRLDWVLTPSGAFKCEN